MRRFEVTARYLISGCLALFAQSCKPDKWATPERSYDTFVTALKKSDQAIAWEGLSKASRAAIEKDVSAAKAVAGDILKADGAAWVMSSGKRATGAEQVRVVERDASHAILEVKGKGVTFREQLVFEDGQWKLDLTSRLTPDPKQP
ncbi:MAG: hypothetical protein K1X64_04205 [Myxococcaceae bacterium]|nr:hypothetical protein [Myxococcaceae bacterium]